MTKQNTINSEKPYLNLNVIVIIYGIICIIATAAAIYSLNAPSSTSTNQPTNTIPRTIDQATISNISSLTGSASELPSSRNNPFAE